MRAHLLVSSYSEIRKSDAFQTSTPQTCLAYHSKTVQMMKSTLQVNVLARYRSAPQMVTCHHMSQEPRHGGNSCMGATDQAHQSLHLVWPGQQFHKPPHQALVPLVKSSQANSTNPALVSEAPGSRCTRRCQTNHPRTSSPVDPTLQ